MARLASGVAAAALIVGGCGKSEKQIAEENCQRVVAKFAAGSNASLPHDQAMGEFDRMRADAETGIIHCKKAGMTDAVTALENAKVEIDRKKEAGREAAAKNAAAAASSAQVASAAKKEAEWPKTQEWIRNRLIEAKSAADAQDWPLANAKLTQAREEFAMMNGTKVQGTPQWTAVKQQIALMEKRVQPHVPQPSDPTSASGAATGADVRGHMPDERWFDGCNMRCRRAVLDRMNDPDSFECKSSTEPQVDGDFWSVRIYYSASGTGVMKATQTTKCFIQGGTVVRME